MTGGLVAFLNARLDEDEAAWRQRKAERGGTRWPWLEDRILREVEAKRAILGMHKIEVKKADVTPFDPWTGERRTAEYDVECELCGWVNFDPTSACPTLLYLAAVWSDHPDYDPGWKP